MNKYAEQSKAVSTGVEEARFKSCSRKRFYPSEEAARLDHPEQRVYKCLFCDGWHLIDGVSLVRRILRPKKTVPAAAKSHANPNPLFVCLVSGWELRRYFLAHGGSQWRLVNLSSGAVAQQLSQMCESISNDLLCTDSVMHDGAYQIYHLTPKGRKKANKLKAKK